METIPTQDFTFDIPHQESYSRGELILRTLLGNIYVTIPHFFLLFFLSVAGVVLRFIAWWVVLFTAQYPRSFFDFQVNLIRWSTRVQARLFHLADGYPAFGMDATDPKIILEVAYPATLSRGLLILRLFFQFFYVIIPHGICLFFRAIATVFVIFFAWWIVLFTGKYPAGMHGFVVGTLRWSIRVGLYLGFLTDKYPPFSGR